MDELPSACRQCDKMHDGECILKECEYETIMNDIMDDLDHAFAFEDQ